MQDERVDAALQNGSAAEGHELLRNRTAEALPRPPAAMIAVTCTLSMLPGCLALAPRRRGPTTLRPASAPRRLCS